MIGLILLAAVVGVMVMAIVIVAMQVVRRVRASREVRQRRAAREVILTSAAKARAERATPAATVAVPEAVEGLTGVIEKLEESVRFARVDPRTVEAPRRPAKGSVAPPLSRAAPPSVPPRTRAMPPPVPRPSDRTRR